MANLSIMGLYLYDQTVLNAFDLPAGVDLETLKANILVECAELEILIPDPAVFKRSLTYWSRANKPIWQKLYNTTQFDYNPIWNKDGIITEEHDMQYTDNEERDLASGATSTGTNQVTGFNAATFQDAEKNTTTGSGTDTGTIDRTRTDTGTITRREQGNIGITTTQQMIKEEREVSQFNIYAYITQAFKSMYCLGVY